MLDDAGRLVFLAHDAGAEPLIGGGLAQEHVTEAGYQPHLDCREAFDSLGDALADADPELQATRRRSDVAGRQGTVLGHRSHRSLHFVIRGPCFAERLVDPKAAWLGIAPVVVVHPLQTARRETSLASTRVFVTLVGVMPHAWISRRHGKTSCRKGAGPPRHTQTNREARRRR